MQQGSFSRLFLAVLKLTVFLACLVIGFKYLNQHKFDHNDINITPGSYLLAALTIFLGCVNWGIEALKWQHLINTITPIKYLKALKATLSGVSTSFVTPFRIGDFFGRVLHLNSNKREASVLTLFGNLTQLIATLLFGMIGVSAIGNEVLQMQESAFTLLLVLGWVVTIAIGAFALFPNSMFKADKFFDYFSIDNSVLHLKSKLTSHILVLSLFRYLVFLLQFILSFKMFGSELEFYQLGLLISLLYLLITFVPSPLLGKLGVRESIGLFLIGPFESTAVILSASLFIWLINLFIPAMIGSVFFWSIKSSKA